jgi:hypothetical protein
MAQHNGASARLNLRVGPGNVEHNLELGNDAPEATGFLCSPRCASIAGPLAQAWKASSDSHCVTTK